MELVSWKGNRKIQYPFFFSSYYAHVDGTFGRLFCFSAFSYRWMFLL